MIDSHSSDDDGYDHKDDSFNFDIVEKRSRTIIYTINVVIFVKKELSIIWIIICQLSSKMNHFGSHDVW